MSGFDLTLFPMTVDAGREQYMLPGLLALSAPRKTARMRAQDMLILFLRMGGAPGSSAVLTNAQQKEIVTKLADTYFNSAGSVTAGMRATAARLNDFMLNRNLKSGNEGHMTGTLTLAVVHAQMLYVAHAGPTHSYFISKGQVQHFDDGQGMRGLGLSRQSPPRFYQASIEAGDMLIFCPGAPADLSRALAGSQQLGFEAVRRRLVNSVNGQIQVAVLRLSAGKGTVSYWRPSDRTTRTAEQGAQNVPAAETTPADQKLDPADHKIDPGASDTAERPIKRPAQADPVVENAAAPSKSRPRFQFRLPFLKPAQPPGAAQDNQAGRAAMTTSQPRQAVDPAAHKIDPAAHEMEPVVHEVDPADHKIDPGEQNFAPAAQEYEQGLSEGAEPVNFDVFPDTAADSSSGPVVYPNGPDGDPQAAALPLNRPVRPVRVEAPAQIEPPALSEPPARARRSARPTVQPSVESAGAPVHSRPAAVPAGPPLSERLRVWLAPRWKKTSLGVQRLGGAASSAAARALPKTNRSPDLPREPLINLSPAWMLLIAVLVPVMVVTAATTVYLRTGRTEQFELLFSQAQQYAAQAGQQSDPALLKQSWDTTLDRIAEAEQYGRTDEMAALKNQAYAALDDLQGVTRLDFQAATTSMYPSDANFTQMVSTLNQVFMLDETTGSIQSMTRITTGGYEPNFKFNCNPAKAGGIIVGPIIDLAIIPINNELGAEILGIDASGNLVYCASNKAGIESTSLPAPDSGWGKITAITTYGNTLYVLDPLTNGVYRYDGVKGLFENKPHFYFDEEIPYMVDVIDLAIDQEFLYLLHADGRMTVCTNGGVYYGITRCTDPAPYGDSRPGFDPAPLVFPDARFTHVLTTDPPDPSLFTLDAANRSIYHLSQRRMNLQREYRQSIESDYPFPERAPSAFAITPNRRALIAFGNQLFFAPLP